MTISNPELPSKNPPPSVVKEFGKSFGQPVQVDEQGKVIKRVFEQGYRHYLVERDDGGISVFVLVDDPNINQYPVIDDEIMKWEQLNDGLPDGSPLKRVRARSNYFVIPEAFPKGAAWLQDAFAYKTRERIDIDLDRAKPVYLKLLRDVRNSRLKEMDGQSFRAFEADDKSTMNNVVAQKKILRDLPDTLMPTIQNAGSLKELIDSWPTDQLGAFPYPETQT